jgi:hypothetical protein
VVVRSNILAVNIRSVPVRSGSEIISFGQEQGFAEAVAAVVAGTLVAAVDGLAVGGCVDFVEVGDETEVRERTEADGGARVDEGTAAGLVAFAGAGAGVEIETVVGADKLADEDAVTAGTAERGATIGILPMIITAFVIVLPQTPQLSSTRAVMVYVPGPTPLRSHWTLDPEPTMWPAEMT